MTAPRLRRPIGGNRSPTVSPVPPTMGHLLTHRGHVQQKELHMKHEIFGVAFDHDVLKAGDLSVLVLFHRLDKISCLNKTLMCTCIKPGISSTKKFYI